MSGSCHFIIYQWIRSFGEVPPDSEVRGSIEEMGFDYTWHYMESKNGLWAVKADDHASRQPSARQIG